MKRLRVLIFHPHRVITEKVLVVDGSKLFDHKEKEAYELDPDAIYSLDEDRVILLASGDPYPINLRFPNLRNTIWDKAHIESLIIQAISGVFLRQGYSLQSRTQSVLMMLLTIALLFGLGILLMVFISLIQGGYIQWPSLSE